MILHVIQSVGLLLTAVLSLAWVAGYHLLTRGAWQASPEGRHLMFFTVCLNALVGLLVVSVVFGADDSRAYQVALTAVFVAAPAAMVDRWRLLLTASRPDSSTAPKGK